MQNVLNRYVLYQVKKDIKSLKQPTKFNEIPPLSIINMKCIFTNKHILLFMLENDEIYLTNNKMGNIKNHF